MANENFYWIDAFTDTPFGGNPCAVLFVSEDFSASAMQAIAREMNLSETAFVFSSKRADFAARYFTPARELPFAGHPTIAVIQALLEAGKISKSGERRVVRLELPAGIIPVELSFEGAKVRISMEQLAPKFLRKYEPSEILRAYGLAAGDLLAGASIETVSTGSPVLMIPLANREALERVRYVDFALHARNRKSGDYLFEHFFQIGGYTSEGATYARSLGDSLLSPEDPFTGSATGCMAAYLWRHGYLPNARFVAEQGHGISRPGKAEIEVIGPRDAIQSVRVAGYAVTLVRGTFPGIYPPNLFKSI